MNFFMRDDTKGLRNALPKYLESFHIDYEDNMNKQTFLSFVAEQSIGDVCQLILNNEVNSNH